MPTICVVVFLASLPLVQSGSVRSCIDTSPCYCHPDSESLEFCEGEVSQSCTNIQTQAACAGQTRTLRELVGGCEDTVEEVACDSSVVTCWTLYQCKWIPGVPSGGTCVNFAVIDSAQTTTATVGACDP